MKKITYTLFVAFAVLICGCSQRRTLSDGELAEIFHDAFLSNSYAMKYGLNLDSLRLYEPIFQSYGYTVDDVQYTIGSFSTRKSARLSDVVERAIEMLESEGETLDWEVTVLDSLDKIATRRTESIYHFDSLLTMRKFRDSTTLKYTFEEMPKGNYAVTFNYFIDSLDTNRKGYRMVKWLEKKIDNKGEGTHRKGAAKPYSRTSTHLIRGREAIYSNSISVDDDCERVVINLAQPVEVKGETSVRIKNFTLRRELSPEEAFDSLYRELLPIKIFDDELLFPPKKDSL